jgi:hypothetical protein
MGGCHHDLQTVNAGLLGNFQPGHHCLRITEQQVQLVQQNGVSGFVGKRNTGSKQVVLYRLGKIFCMPPAKGTS